MKDGWLTSNGKHYVTQSISTIMHQSRAIYILLFRCSLFVLQSEAVRVVPFRFARWHRRGRQPVRKSRDEQRQPTDARPWERLRRPRHLRRGNTQQTESRTNVSYIQFFFFLNSFSGFVRDDCCLNTSDWKVSMDDAYTVAVLWIIEQHSSIIMTFCCSRLVCISTSTHNGICNTTTASVFEWTHSGELLLQ